MIERLVELDANSVLDICGVNNANIELLKHIFPKLGILARGNELKIMGENDDIEAFLEKFNALLLHYQKYAKLSETDIVNLTHPDNAEFYVASIAEKEVILYGRNGKVIKARTPNQQRIVEEIIHNDIVFAIGPAGTGKTYTAVALAVRALKNKEIKRIVLTRPAVEAGENLGFLPGDMRDKLDPYLQPLYDALRDMIPGQKLLAYLEDRTIEIAPLAFMRGRTLDNAYVILDEAQNATSGQLKMFLTRMGNNAKFFITGDISQIDLPRNQQSGLVQAQHILKGIKGISFVHLDASDVVRHRLVTKVIQAYDKAKDTELDNKKHVEKNS